jgi:hypothetical protein
VAKSRAPQAVVGVAEHGNSAVLVTIANGALVDRRRVDRGRSGVT